MVVLKELSQILGLFRRPPAQPQARADDALTAPLLELLIDLRARLRKEKNFALADEIRNRLTELGVTLEDRADGTRWRIEPGASRADGSVEHGSEDRASREGASDGVQESRPIAMATRPKSRPARRAWPGAWGSTPA